MLADCVPAYPNGTDTCLCGSAREATRAHTRRGFRYMIFFPIPVYKTPQHLDLYAKSYILNLSADCLLFYGLLKPAILIFHIIVLLQFCVIYLNK